MDGRVLQVSVSPGGVPKLPVERARVGRMGLEGDAHTDDTVHGGPHRAVALFAIEAIRRVAAEGHPIAPGTAGENLTTEGIEIASLPVGTRLAVGEDVVLEIASPDNPCSTIRGSFSDERFARISILTHPLDTRMYARVVSEGVVRRGDPIRLLPGPPEATAVDFTDLVRIADAHRASSVAQWAAAAAGGIDVDVIDDGDIAIAATPSVPGPWLNQALGFDLLPNLIDRALDHFRRRDVVGWLELDPDDPDAPAIEPDLRLAVHAAAPEGVAPAPAIRGLTVRRVGPDEAEAWALTLVRSDELSDSARRAWIALAPDLAATPHHSLWLAELDGTPVGTGSLHVLRKAGLLRSGSVVPEARGRGIQRAIVEARVRAAAEAGATVVGAVATPGSSSERNLATMGFRPIALRGHYPSTAF